MFISPTSSIRAHDCGGKGSKVIEVLFVVRTGMGCVYL